MNDPHVAALRYRLTVDESLEFRNPPDLQINTTEFTGHLSKEVLTLVPKKHFKNESEIKPIADSFIVAWEIDAGLRYGPKIHFHFDWLTVNGTNKPIPVRMSVGIMLYRGLRPMRSINNPPFRYQI
jgi:hypothetical protein